MSSYRMQLKEKNRILIETLLNEVPEFVKSYILSINNSTSASTQVEYLRDIKRFLTYITESYTEKDLRDIKDVTLEVLESLDIDFLNSYTIYLRTYRENGEIRSNENISIRRKMSSIRNLYSFLYLNDMIKDNPMVKINQPKVEKKEIIRMDKDESSDFIDVVKNGYSKAGKMQSVYHEKQKHRDIALISLLLGTGMRVSECVGLNIKDIDIKHYAVNILRKGGKEEIVYMSDELTGIMQDYIEYRKTITALPPHEDALFLSSQKKRMSVRAVEILVKKYKEQAEISKNITPHKLRSTFGTNLYEATGDLYLVAEVLGHSSVETTKSHYANISNRHKFDNRNKITPLQEHHQSNS